MKISIVAAAADNDVIGNQNQLPWEKLSKDKKRFREITTGHHVIIGRKTYESIGRLLPNRTNIIISRNSDLAIEGAIVVDTLKKALDLAKQRGETDAMVIGGGEIYALALPFADRIYLTRVHCEPVGDAYFPKLSPLHWELRSTESHKKDEANQYDFDFCLYVAK